MGGMSSRTWVDDGRMSADGAKVIMAVRVASERKAVRNSMAARGSGGLLLCVGFLLTMPALAATPADRGECAASADKLDFGGAACSRIIDGASEQLAERVEAFKNRGRGSFNRKDYDRAIADYGEAIKLSPKDAWAFAHRCEAYESKRTTTRPLRIAPRRSRSIRNMAGPTTTVASPITVCMNTTQRWPTMPRRSGSIPGTCGPMPAAAWRGRKRVNSTRRSPISPRRSQSIRNTPLRPKGSGALQEEVDHEKRRMGARDRRLQ